MLAIFDLDGFKVYNDTFGHPAGDSLLARLAANLSAVTQSAGSCYRLGGDEFCVLSEVRPADAESFLQSAAAALSEEGEGFGVTSSFGAVSIPEEAAGSSDALRVADQRMYAQKQTRGRGSTHEVLLQALYEREPGLRLHVQSVAEAAAAVGAALGLGGEALEELRLAARLHDVGKLAIPDTVLQKPGPLDVEEWAFIKEHTVIGERILAASPPWKRVAAIVRATHERWDGTGYPDGLAGAAIPLAARIIAVCDAFSAMTSRRPYRVEVTRDAALEELRRCAGTQFDPEVVAVFCREAQRASSASWAAAAAERACAPARPARLRPPAVSGAARRSGLREAGARPTCGGCASGSCTGRGRSSPRTRCARSRGSRARARRRCASAAGAGARAAAARCGRQVEPDDRVRLVDQPRSEQAQVVPVGDPAVVADQRCRDLFSQLLRLASAPVRAVVERVQLDVVEPELLGELPR